MKIILDNDATIVDYGRFIKKYAVPYFKKKYNMDVVNEGKLELEEIFDCENVLIKRGYSDIEADEFVNKIISKFWISPRYLLYSMPWMFFPKAAQTLRILKKQGHHIEIHTSKMYASKLTTLGKITRILMYLQYWGNGIWISCKDFKFYDNDEMKLSGIMNSYPEIVFEDKTKIIKLLSNSGVKCICVLGLHNGTIEENENVKKLNGFEYCEVSEIISRLIGKSRWELYNEMSYSDLVYRKILKLRFAVKWMFRPIVLNENRIMRMDNKGVIYASNHRSTLDPIIITSIVNEPIRYAALKRFFDGEDSIFNNSKNSLLCKITAKLFVRLKYFPIERIQDNEKADNTKSLREMLRYSRINGKIGIFPEGTTLKNQEKDFNIFDGSFIKLAVHTNAIIQPISIFWFTDRGKKRCVINFGEAINANKYDTAVLMDIFINCQKNLLRENRDVVQKYVEVR